MRPAEDDATVAHYACSGELGLAHDVRAVFERIAAEREVRVVMLLPPTAPPTRELVALIVAGCVACPSLEELVLVHPNPVLAFIVSAIALQVSDTQVSSRTTM